MNRIKAFHMPLKMILMEKSISQNFNDPFSFRIMLLAPDVTSVIYTPMTWTPVTPGAAQNVSVLGTPDIVVPQT